MQITLPELNENEKYAGFTMKDGKPFEHIILLPGKSEEVEWEEAKTFAAEQGGRLPNRQEGALLYANLKEDFDADWYWLADEHSSVYAWIQGFSYGNQFYDDKDHYYLARAVRSEVITD